ncbi:DMP19 family protein [Spirosoma horti]
MKPSLLLIILLTMCTLLGCSEKPHKEEKVSIKDTVDTRISKFLNDFKNRPIHRILTEQIIDSTSDEKLVQVVFDNLTQKLPTSYTEEEEYETILGWNKSRQAIYMIWILESEVNNGGYNQFYSNSGSQYAKYLPNALKLVGADRLADLTQRANDVFEKENEKTTENQDSTTIASTRSYPDYLFKRFDNDFYEIAQADSLNQVQVDFIRSHKGKFIDN